MKTGDAAELQRGNDKAFALEGYLRLYGGELYGDEKELLEAVTNAQAAPDKEQQNQQTASKLLGVLGVILIKLSPLFTVSAIQNEVGYTAEQKRGAYFELYLAMGCTAEEARELAQNSMQGFQAEEWLKAAAKEYVTGEIQDWGINKMKKALQ